MRLTAVHDVCGAEKEAVLDQAASLLCAEWGRGRATRVRALESSREALPCYVVLRAEAAAAKGEEDARKDEGVVLAAAKVMALDGAADDLLLESVVVHPAVRGCGVGKTFLLMLEALLASRWRARRVTIVTADQHAFYARCGYAPSSPPFTSSLLLASFLAPPAAHADEEEEGEEVAAAAPKPPPPPPRPLGSAKTAVPPPPPPPPPQAAQGCWSKEVLHAECARGLAAAALPGSGGGGLAERVAKLSAAMAAASPQPVGAAEAEALWGAKERRDAEAAAVRRSGGQGAVRPCGRCRVCENFFMSKELV